MLELRSQNDEEYFFYKKKSKKYEMIDVTLCQRTKYSNQFWKKCADEIYFETKAESLKFHNPIILVNIYSICFSFCSCWKARELGIFHNRIEIETRETSIARRFAGWRKPPNNKQLNLSNQYNRDFRSWHKFRQKWNNIRDSKMKHDTGQSLLSPLW